MKASTKTFMSSRACSAVSSFTGFNSSGGMNELSMPNGDMGSDTVPRGVDTDIFIDGSSMASYE